MRLLRRPLLTVLGASAMLVACSAPAAPAPTSAPAAAKPPAAATTAPSTAGGAPVAAGKPGGLDMNAIFPAGSGRDLVVQNCSNCHNIVPVVMGKKPKAQWDTIEQNHVQRLSGLSRDQVNVVFDYLSEHFGPDDPEPQLPQELLDAGTAK
jgi:hypothetical protein